MNISRYLLSQLKTDLNEKMVFLGGPRQVGKTTLARHFIESNEQYLNWDLAKDRKTILKEELNIHLKLIILDEIHKYKNWRRLLKGYYDKFYPELNFLITSSARLDTFRKGGD
jgi:predicted AAA+ superfamily ATPase